MRIQKRLICLLMQLLYLHLPKLERKEVQRLRLRVDLFTSQPAYTSAVPSTFDFFSSDEPVAQPGIEAPKSDPPNTNVNDPFAAVAMNNFDGSDLFGVFTSSSNPASSEPTQSPIKDSSLDNLDGKSFGKLQSSTKRGFPGEVWNMGRFT
ncbi:EPSIN/ENT-RELATED [Salix koriyanagi]|uniref:EPSIN/ENT-RELATED n=1 Tax=Salix koriyanagi TaxID=2511006 RepID=A0A9Q0VDK3_9ROSI|nr:EPSIN/ENT-RELATED [Salix koriyanagi]